MRKILIGLVLLALPSCAMVMRAPSTTPGFMVYFDPHSATVDQTAAGTISRAAEAAKAAPSAPVVVKGYTDSAGNAAADVTLSQTRAQAVADALKSDGVDAARISIRGRGQTHEEPGQASRRVEIDVGG
jgi:outer membrane protein OmpA-like peptidoglycan-associated protein